MICKSEALVLKSFDYRETSKIVRFFSKDFGKVTGVLKGIRKNPKKFGSSADKFSLNDIVYYEYRNSDLHLVSQCDLRNYFFPIRENLKRSMAASYMLELVDAIMPVQEKNLKVYKLIINFLNSLEEVKDINKLVYIFQIKMLLLSGFRPMVDTCVKTGKPIRGRAKFSLVDGGLVSMDYNLRDTKSIIISQGTISSILHIEQSPWQKSLQLGLTPIVQKELKFILNNFLLYHLGKRVKSEKYL